MCVAAAELTHISFLCAERRDSVRMSQQGVLLDLFTAGVCLRLLFLSGFL